MAALTLEPTSTRPDARSIRQRRIETLADRVLAIDPGLRAEARELVMDVCESFDVAAEFAACEGLTISQALAGYFAEAEPPGTRWGRVQAVLRQLATPADSQLVRPDQLPVMPAAALKLLRTDEDSATVVQLGTIASSDPVLSARILSLANSARFGSRFEITMVSEAIQRIGVPEARRTLLASCLSGLFASRTLQSLWAHSQLVADLAWKLARDCGADPGAAYTAGLLHEIGRLVFLRGPAGRQADEWVWLDEGFPLVYAETLVRGSDHAAQGAELLAAWQLPSELVEAVRFHHRPECVHIKPVAAEPDRSAAADEKSSLLAHILFLAEDLAAILSDKPAEDLWNSMRRHVAMDRAGITAECLVDTVSEIRGTLLRRVG